MLKEVFLKFDTTDEFISAEAYGSGHINDTYLVVTKNSNETRKYIMQRINNKVFADVKTLMENIRRVTEYILDKLKKEGKPTDKALRVIGAGGKNYAEVNGNFYRLYNFIDGAISIDKVEDEHLFYLSGKGFGKFQNLLNGYPADELKEPIPHFHDTEDRFSKFETAIKEDAAGRLKEVKDEVEFFVSRKAYCSRILDLIRANKIPLRVTHNDTKLNNVLIDIKNDVASTVIDLDTVMPGSIVYDFGDSIRYGANTGAEDEKDLSKVNFSLEYFEAYAKGFLEEVGEVLTEDEIDNMAFGAVLMTYECGMRFLTDYLSGDVYFKIHREGHNLDRARTQIKMVSDMEAQSGQMKQIILKYTVDRRSK